MAGTVFTDCSCSYSAASALSYSPEFASAFAEKCVTNACSWHSPGRSAQGEVANSGTSGCVVAWSVGREEGSSCHSSGDFPAHSEPASSPSGPASVPGLLVTEGEFSHSANPTPGTHPGTSCAGDGWGRGLRRQLTIVSVKTACLPWLMAIDVLINRTG